MSCESEDLLEEWLKRDPLLLDTEGYLKLLEEKHEGTRVRLTVGRNQDWTYSIFIELADVKLGDAFGWEATDVEELEEIRSLSNRFTQMLKKIDFRPGATYVFREKDKWYWWGDLDHIPKEDILHNVKTLCKFWQAVGRQVKGAFGVSKAYDRSLYVETLSSTEQGLPAISIMHYDMPSFHRNLDHQPIHPLEEFEEELSDEWLTLEVYTKRLLLSPEIDEDWLERKDELVPVCLVYREDIPSVERFLAKQREEWNPFDDEQIQRNEALELLHPALQKVLTLVWNDSLVTWEEDAQEALRLYYKRHSIAELEEKKVEELKEICHVKKLNPVGGKDELIERIIDFDAKLQFVDTTPDDDVYDYQSL